MEGTSTVVTSSTGEKLIFLSIGLLAGLGLMAVVNHKLNQKKLDAATDSAKGQGYTEAHQNFEKLLIWGHENRVMPIDLHSIITAEE